MKLLLYSHAFPPSVGGVETIVAALARGLASMSDNGNKVKHQVTVVTQTPAGNFDDASFCCHIVRQPSFLTLAKLIRTSDVVHVAGPALAPMFLSWLVRKPYVVEHHGYQSICPNGILLQQPDSTVCPGHFQAAHYRKCITCESQNPSQKMSWLRSALKVLQNVARHSLAKRAATNIAVSNHVAKRLALPRTSVIYHGLDPHSPQPAPPPTHSSAHNGNIRFGYVGRFVPEKGIPTLIEAARILRRDRQDFEVLLVGDGPLRSKLEETIRLNHADRFIHITGFLRGEELAATLNSIDAVVMPSIWEETAGLAAIEQMASGRLVIVSDVGGLGEIVAHTGLKCPPGDSQSLASQMGRVLQDNAQVSALGAAARERSQSVFCEERMTAEHLAAYSTVQLNH